jgi:hypothetical protein
LAFFLCIIVELLCAQLITLSSFSHHFTPVISQVKKSALCQFYITYLLAASSNIPVIYL